MKLHQILEKIRRAVLGDTTPEPTQPLLTFLEPKPKRRRRYIGRHARGDIKTVNGETLVFWQYSGTYQYWVSTEKYQQMLQRELMKASKRKAKS